MNLKLLAMENKDSPAKKDKKDDKKNKHKVTFIDKMDKDAELTRIHHVQSYKKYNSMNTYDPYYVEEGEGSSHCCTIFWIWIGIYQADTYYIQLKYNIFLSIKI